MPSSSTPPDPRSPRPVRLVSACLLGVPCRYDGATASDDARDRAAAALDDDASVVPICPEAAGGMPTPRPAAQIVGGTGLDVLEGSARVITDDGDDVTAAFLRGAEAAVAAAARFGATEACLKARSPSCGVGRVHSKSGLVDGDGVAAAALKRAGLRVLNDEQGRSRE